MVKYILSDFKGKSTSKNYKTWILYNLGTDLDERSYAPGVMAHVPKWFSSCYKIYLNPNSSLFEEILGLNQDLVHKYYGTFETGL